MSAALYVFDFVSPKSTTHDTAFSHLTSRESLARTVKSVFEIW
jgi:hypothetical protein